MESSVPSPFDVRDEVESELTSSIIEERLLEMSSNCLLRSSARAYLSERINI